MSEPLDYIGVAPCGCVRVWISGDTTGMTPKEVAKDVADIVRRGLDLRRVTTEQARWLPHGCDACKAAEAKGRKRTAKAEGRP